MLLNICLNCLKNNISINYNFQIFKRVIWLASAIDKIKKLERQSVLLKQNLFVISLCLKRKSDSQDSMVTFAVILPFKSIW